MDRSLAGRTGIGRLFDPSPRRARRTGRARTHRAGMARERARRLYAHLQRWWWPFARVVDLVRAGCSNVWHRRRLRIGLLAGLLSLLVLAGGWLWLRHSSLVAVEHVRVSGVHGPEAKAIDAALARAARQMSTLDVRTGALNAAVAPYRVVREVRATASFPHGLHIRVIEQLPVAALTVNGERTAVAADGVVLGPALLSGSLPALAGGLNGSAAGLPQGGRVHSGSLLASLTLLGAAPAPMARAVVRVFTGPKGVTAAMRSGLIVYFGDATPPARQVAIPRAGAHRSELAGRLLRRRAPARTARRGLLRRVLLRNEHVRRRTGQRLRRELGVRTRRRPDGGRRPLIAVRTGGGRWRILERRAGGSGAERPRSDGIHRLGGNRRRKHRPRRPQPGG